jgi:hypothetical protein
MAFTRTPIFRSIVALTILALPVAAFASDFGRASGGGSSIEWSLNISGHERVQLTVLAPNGNSWVRNFNAGRNPSFRILDLGTDLEDGRYNYEMRVVPKISSDLKKKLEAARAAGDEAGARKLIKDAGIVAPVQSGTFTILNGMMVSPDGVEADSNDDVVGTSNPRGVSSNAVKPRLSISTEDQVIADDLIVQSSICTGFDCVSGESFGFDTFRLKENNLRIHFDDTSASAGYPANDWRFIANDSGSGGGNFMAIEDSTAGRNVFVTEAGAPANALYVDSTGNIGISQSAPLLDLHITAGDTPAVRLEQSSASGFTAQTWDVGANEANFFVRDLTGGSRLSFRIRPGAPTSSIDIAASGKVGIGTASPDEQLDVVQNTDANIVVEVGNNSTGLSANAGFRSEADVASVSFQSHGSGRTISRFGKVLASWNEMLATAGNGLILGTNTATPLILGTNGAARLTIDSTGNITVPGNFTVTGTKNFGVPDPADSSKAIYFSALEGPEAGTYYRGTAKTINGEVRIKMPGHFSRMTEKERMTVQLTPLGAPGQLYVASRSPEEIVIKVAEGAPDLEFDYLVQGVRKGYLNFEVERTNNLN